MAQAITKARLLSRIDELLQLAHDTVMTAYGGAASIRLTDYGLATQLRSAGLSFLQNLYGNNHPHFHTFAASVHSARESCAEAARGVLFAVRSEIEGGWLTEIRTIVSGEIFSDFLEMADYLLEQHYKDAAAVIAGGVLEEHLRKLSDRHGIPTTELKGARTVPKKSENLNTDLKAAGAYDLGEQKQVTAWLDLRNNAAHGHYGKYTDERVQLMLDGVRSFISRTT